MSLVDKLARIYEPRVIPLQNGEAQTIEAFWNTFISCKLPKKDIVLKWHEVLLKYVTQPDAMFAIRGYNTAPKEEYDNLRRGFLSKTNAGYSFFYTDNFHAAYFLKMALMGYVPTVEEMIDAYNSRRFPARFGPITSNEKVRMAIPQGRDPGIQNAGYKIAHILNVGMDYFADGKSISLSQIIHKYFNGGKRSDWKLHNDMNGEFFLRNYEVHPNARKFLIAEYLRFVHPFNYFLTPKKSCAHTPVAKDIAEYNPLIDFVQAKYETLYGDAYNEFISLVMSEKASFSPVDGNNIINLKYGLNNIKPPVLKPIPKKVIKTGNLQNSNSCVSSNSVPITKEVEISMVIEYLVNPKTSFRKLENQFMGINSPARGGGFIAKKIINSYGIIAKMKGILSNNSIESVILSSTGELKETLIKIKKFFT